MADRVGKVLEGKYRLLRLIGKGGMGAVYEAQHTKISRKMAIKLLHAELADSAEMAERFTREAQAASSIGHPNIVEIQDVGQTEDGAVFIVMELLEGRSLTSLLSSSGTLPPGQAVSITLQILSALRAAHAKGIIHRDLKPDNVFLARDRRANVQVKIVDFGISKIKDSAGAEPGLTKTGAVLGTPYYMAPEQARGEKDIDERIDIWSMGVMLFQMLSGKLPYPGDSYNAVISKILTEPVPPIMEAAPDIPEGLAAIVDKALAKDRDERYRDVKTLAEALEPFCDGPIPEVFEAMAETVQVESGVTGDDSTDAFAKTTPASELQKEDSKPGEPETEKALKASTPTAIAAPLWKSILWYLVVIVMQIPIWGSAFEEPRATMSAFGLPPPYTTSLALVISALLGAGLILAAFFLARFWSRRIWNRWLMGSGFIIFPLIGLLLILLHYLTLEGQLESHMTSLRSYSIINQAQASSIADMIESSMWRFMCATVMDQNLVSTLATMVLLGYLFLRPAGSSIPGSWKKWLVLPAGIVVIVVADALVFRRQLSDMGPMRFFLYGMWVLTAIAVLRIREPRVKDIIPGWRSVFTGLLSVIALLGLYGTMGYIMAIDHIAPQPLDVLPAEERAWLFNNDVTVIIIQGSIVLLGILLFLFAGLVVVCRRVFPFTFNARVLFKQVLPAVAILVVTALPFFILLSAMSRVDRQWLPCKLVSMHPATTEKGAPASFYIDKQPQALFRGRLGLFSSLTGKSRREYSAEALAKNLAGHEKCPEVLSEALKEKGERPPARCVTAIEARLYCEALGKRLPTPAEWKAASGGEQPFERGEFGEWTMRMVHGTPTFKIMGFEENAKIPKELDPDKFSGHVGFRCVFSF